MALTEADRKLLERCLNREAGAWNDFVDRYLGLIYHVIQYTAYHRSVPITAEDVEDLAGEVLLQVVAKDYAVLKRFKRRSSLAAYLTVIARRICVHELSRRAAVRDLPPADDRAGPRRESQDRGQLDMEGLEEMQKILRKLPAREREVVRMYYVEGRAYEEIATALHVPVNSIGPVLSRARQRLKKDAESRKRAARRPQPKPAPPTEEGGADRATQTP